MFHVWGLALNSIPVSVGEADPRTQKSSSFHDPTLRISDKAPPEKGRGKWSTSEVGCPPRWMCVTLPVGCRSACE